MQESVIKTKGLGKRYGSFWALKECSINLPKGRVSALVGPNGAGKSTLMKMLVGLSSVTTGEKQVLGKSSTKNGELLHEVGYLGQEVPLYKSLDASEHIKMCSHLNKNFDSKYAEKHLNELDIPLNKATGKLSGGQKAQVALALALAKKPKLLLLDEPVAALDPLARKKFLSSLSQAVASSELTVMMSSHLLDDLERVSDHVIVLASGKTQLCDDVDKVLSEHKVLIGPNKDIEPIVHGSEVISEERAERQATLLVRTKNKLDLPKIWRVEQPNIEEIILAYMGQNGGAK